LQPSDSYSLDAASATLIGLNLAGTRNQDAKQVRRNGENAGFASEAGILGNVGTANASEMQTTIGRPATLQEVARWTRIAISTIIARGTDKGMEIAASFQQAPTDDELQWVSEMVGSHAYVESASANARLARMQSKKQQVSNGHGKSRTDPWNDDESVAYERVSMQFLAPHVLEP